MKVRWLLVLAAAACVGLLASGVLNHAHDGKAHRDGGIAARARTFVQAVAIGEIEAAIEQVDSTEGNSDRLKAGVTLLTGVVQLDRSLESQFGFGLEPKPLPVPDSFDFRSVERRKNYAVVGPAEAQLVDLDTEYGWRLDPRPFVEGTLGLAAAEAMRAELVALAERVEAGEFATREEALAAYDAAAFRGLLAAAAASPATRPADD